MEKISALRWFFNRVLFDKVLYDGPRKRWVVEGKAKEETGTPAGRVDTVILGKAHYFETTKTFPLSSLSEIRSAVAMDLASHCPFATERFFVRKIDKTEGRTRVNLWFLSPKALSDLERLSPWLVLPESALLSLGSEKSAVIYNIDKGEERLYTYIGVHGEVRSLVERGSGEDVGRFRKIIGADARDCETVSIRGLDDYIFCLASRMQGMTLKDVMCFLNRKALLKSLDMPGVKRYAAAAAAALVLYGVFWASMPFWVQKSLENDERALAERLAGEIRKQEDLENYLEKQKMLAQRINAYTGKIGLFNLLKGLLPEGTKIRQITVAGKVVEIRGYTPKGSVLLEALGREKSISDARFTAPLRQNVSGGTEDFTLMFSFQAGPEAP